MGSGQEGELSWISGYRVTGLGGKRIKSRSMSWADPEWYLALLPVGPWASYIMPLGLHSLVPELG